MADRHCALPLGTDVSCGPVFIVGCGRSGTTLLRLILNAHPQPAIFGESGAFFRTGKYGFLESENSWKRFVRDWTSICAAESAHPKILESEGLRRKLRNAGSYTETLSMLMSAFAELEGKKT